MPPAPERFLVAQAVDCAIKVLGDELGQELERLSERRWGPAWPDILAERHAPSRVHTRDPQFVLKEARRTDSPLWDLKRPDTRLHNRLRRALDLRNDYAHMKKAPPWPTPGQAIEDVELLTSVARSYGLALVPELDGLQTRLRKLSSGWTAPTELDGEERDALLREFEESQRRADALVAETRADADALRAERDEMADRLADARAEINAMRQPHHEDARASEERRHALQALEATVKDLSNQLTQARDRAEVGERSAQLAREEQGLMAAELGRTIQELQRQNASQALELAALLTAAATREDTKAAREISRARKTATTVPIQRRHGQVSPGDVWVGKRGERVLTLSKVQQDLFDPETNRWLSKATPGMRDVARQFLKIRPSGGRVWIDDSANAVTLIGGKLVYLGRFETEVRHTDPPPGTVIEGEPVGRPFSLHLNGDVTDRASNRKLSTVRGSAARTVGRRLLLGRKDGGRIFVAPDGRVTSTKNGRTVFVGRVTPQEWFAS